MTDMNTPTVNPPGTENNLSTTWENMRVLAEDQIETERKVATLERNQKVMAAALLGTAGAVIIGYKALTNLMKAMNGIAQYLGQQSGQQVPQEVPDSKLPPKDTGPRETGTDARQWTEPTGPPVMENKRQGEGFDPGPQDIPEEVKRALEQDDITPDIINPDDVA